MVRERPLHAGQGPNQVQQHWKAAGGYSTVGLELAISVLVGLFAGQWLDKKFEAGGLLTAAGFGFGLFAGGRTVYRALKKANAAADKEAEQEREETRNYLDGK